MLAMLSVGISEPLHSSPYSALPIGVCGWQSNTYLIAHRSCALELTGRNSVADEQ